MQIQNWELSIVVKEGDDTEKGKWKGEMQLWICIAAKCLRSKSRSQLKAICIFGCLITYHLTQASIVCINGSEHVKLSMKFY